MVRTGIEPLTSYLSMSGKSLLYGTQSIISYILKCNWKIILLHIQDFHNFITVNNQHGKPN
jgi:hypothetical protein